MADRIKVVFASLLKPVDEPRMYEKLGRSLAQTYKYDVNIIGFASKNLTADPLITFWPLFNFPRISPQRLLAPYFFFKKLLQLKPELIVVTNPEFLPVSIAYKILFGCPIIYDLQENYYRNIIWSHQKPSLPRKIRAHYIRGIETIADRMINRYTLAERCYSTECSFINQPVNVLENKARKPEANPANPISGSSRLKIIYTGTVAVSYGILDTFPLVDAIKEIHPDIQYTICGHCPSEELKEVLLRKASSRPWLKLIISENPIPHKQILQELREAHFSLIAYKLNPSNENCMPTRVWEALAWKVPMILKADHPWINIAKELNAGFPIDFLNPDIDKLEHCLLHQQYHQKELPEDIYWESIEKEWIDLVDSLFH